MQNFAMIYVQLLSYELYICELTRNLDTFPAKKRWMISTAFVLRIVIRNGKIVWRHGIVNIFAWNEISGVAIQKILQNIKNGYFQCFSEEFLSENNFEIVLTNFYCYKYDANNSEAVEKIATY